tara:strand:- start:11 stop:559 length:549 start_codon:yes stop_codon:yes gene_type:complete
MLSGTLKSYWDVSLFKQSPENTPCSNALLFIFACFFYLVVVSQWTIVETKSPISFNQMLMSGLSLCISYAFYTYTLLKVSLLEARFIQTLTSLFAVHIIIHFFAYPILLATPLLNDEHMARSLSFIISAVYLLCTLLLTIWQVLVTYFIYKKALNAESVHAVMATIGLFVMNILLVSLAAHS